MAYPRNKINVNGHEWNFIKMGKGKPLLLLHGIINYADFYLSTAELLKKDFEIIIPDLPGFGFTKKLPQGNSYTNISEELFSFLKLTGFLTTNIYGFSMGGLIGLELLRNHPEEIRTIIIHSAPWRKNDIKLTSFENNFIHKFLYKMPFRLVNLFKQYILINTLPAVTTIEGETIKNVFRSKGKEITESLRLLDVQGTIEVFKSIENMELEELLSATSVNTIIVGGTKDEHIDAIEEEELARKINARKFILLKNADHEFILNEPHKLAKIIYTQIRS